MARTQTALGALALLTISATAFSAPIAAQEPYMWSGDRPDGVAPAGIFADRVLPVGAFEVSPSFATFDRLGSRAGSDLIAFSDLFQFFDFAPFALNTQRYGLTLSYGATETFTLLGRVGYVDVARDHITEDDLIFTLENDGVSDLEVHGLWEVYREGGWRGHLQGGIVIPTGTTDADDGAPGIRANGVLPYDMQIGAGVFAARPGFTIQSMNEAGSVGLQVLGTIYFGENDEGWRPGHVVDVNGWAAYRFNDFFSVSSGLRASDQSSIQGFDPSLDPERDPAENPLSFAAQRVDIPLGVNLRMPEGPLAGHHIGVEFLWNVHEEFDGILLAADDGWAVKWTAIF